MAALLKDVIPAEQTTIFAVSPDSDLQSLLEILHKHSIQSAPVVDSTKEVNKLLGLVDLPDVLNFIFQTNCALEDINLKNYTCKEAMNASGRNECVPVTVNTTLFSALESFSEGVHRLPVLDEKGDVIYIFSQHGLLKLVHEGNVLQEYADMTCLKAGLGRSKAKLSDLVSCDGEKTTALEAFNIMNQHYLSSIAIVESDAGGSEAMGGDNLKLKAQLSASDLRLLGHTFDTSLLKLPVLEFVKRVHAANHQREDFLVWAMVECKVVEIIEKMVTNGVHRVYLIDNYTNFYGVVSCTDVFRLLFQANNENKDKDK